MRRFQWILMLKVQCNILKSAQSEGSISAYVQILNYGNFCTDWKFLVNLFVCSMHISRHTSIFPWNLDVPTNYLQCKYIYDRVKEYLLYFWIMKAAKMVCLDIFKPCLVFICCFCTRCIWCHRRNILTKIFRSKDELIRYLLASIFDR